MRCAQLIYRCASRGAVKRVQRSPHLFAVQLQQRTYIGHNTASVGVVSTTQLFAPRPRWIESRHFSSETTTTDVNKGDASQGQKKKTQRTHNNNNNYSSSDSDAVNIFKTNDEAELDNYQLESKTIGQLIAIMTTLWVKFSNGAKALNIWNNAIYPRTGTNNMSVEEALEIVPVLADLKQYNHAIEVYEHVLRPALLARRLRVSQLNGTGPHTYKRGNYSRPAALPSLFHAFFTRVAMSEFPTPQQVTDASTDHARTAEEVQRDAERLLELWNWVWEEDHATKPTARYLTREVPTRVAEVDKEIADMPSKQLLNVTRVKEQTTITLSAHKAAKLLSNARALEQIMEYIPQRNWRIVRNTYEILIKEAVTQGKDGALKALEQFQTLCHFGVNSPALCKTVVMALREQNRHHEIVQLAHQISSGELDLGKMVPDRATLNAIIHACHETHQTRAAIDTWNWFVRQYEQRSESRAVSAVLESDAAEGSESAEVTVSSDRDKDKDVMLKPYFTTIEKYLMLISTSNSPVSEAEKLLKTIKTHFAPVSASTYAGMLRIAAKANNIDFAIALWTDMKQQAKQQLSGAESSATSENDQSYNDAVVYASMAQTLLLLLGRQLTSEAWHTRAEMILGELTQLFNTNITHNFVNAFIDQTLRRNYHPETVLDMVTSFIKITGKYPTDVPILRELFDQAAKLGRAELALALFATLKDAQTSSGEEGEQNEMYSTLLIAYARSGELDKLARVWTLMKQQNIVPNESGFTAVLEGFKDKDAEKGADLIIQAKSVPATIYAATLEALLNENKVDKAAEVFTALYSREPVKLQRVNKNVLRRLSTALAKDKTVALRNSVMPHLRAAISF